MLKVQTLLKLNFMPSLVRVIILIFLPTFLLISASSDKIKTVKLGKKMPASLIEMKGTDGATYTLKGLKKEKGLVVVFSCNTCPFVVGSTSFPGWERNYNSLAKKADQAGLGFILINSNEAKRENEDAMEAMIARGKEQNYVMPYLVDKDSKVADAFGARTTPHVFVFNADEKLIYRGSIDNTWDNQRSSDIFYLEELFTALESNSKITNKDTPPRGCSIKRNSAN